MLEGVSSMYVEQKQLGDPCAAVNSSLIACVVLPCRALAVLCAFKTPRTLAVLDGYIKYVMSFFFGFLRSMSFIRRTPKERLVL